MTRKHCKEVSHLVLIREPGVGGVQVHGRGLWHYCQPAVRRPTDEEWRAKAWPCGRPGSAAAPPRKPWGLPSGIDSSVSFGGQLARAVGFSRNFARPRHWTAHGAMVLGPRTCFWNPRRPNATVNIPIDHARSIEWTITHVNTHRVWQCDSFTSNDWPKLSGKELADHL